MRKALVMLALASQLFSVDFCQQHKEKLYSLLDEIDIHIKAGRTISLCNTIDRAQYYNRKLLVQCKQREAIQTKRYLDQTNKFYCGGKK